MRVTGRVQLSTYRMRSTQLQVAEEFLEHVKILPLQYDKGIYFAFLEDYGTHYTKTGKAGGEYELIYVLNQDTIKAKSRFVLASVSFQKNTLSVVRALSTVMLIFIFFADITENMIQNCVKLGVGADFGITSSSSLNAKLDNKNCKDVTNKDQGQQVFFSCFSACNTDILNLGL